MNTVNKTVTVNPLPTVGVSPSTPTAICTGNSTTLTASGASTYSWSPATGLSATTGATVTASPTTTTTYTVTGTDAQWLHGNGHEDRYGKLTVISRYQPHNADSLLRLRYRYAECLRSFNLLLEPFNRS